MTRLGFVAGAIAFGLVANFAIAAETRDEIADTLIALEKRSWEAWKARDGKFFDGFLSDDHVEVGVTGPAGKAAIVGFVGSPACTVKSYSVDKFKVTLFDANTALLVYWAEQDTICGSAPVPSPAWASSLYVKRDGKWLNALYQQTQAIKPKAPASPS